jgi:hypothetical protein
MPAFEIEGGESSAFDIRRHAGIGLRDSGSDLSRIWLLLVEDCSNVGDRAWRGAEALALELGGNLAGLLETHRRFAVRLASSED